MTTTLTFTSVTLTHGDGDETVTALDSVNLQLDAGEFVAVVGPSGSGKSSLLAVAGGLTVPTSGDVQVLDTDLVAATPRERDALRRRHIGFVFQSSNLVPALTSLDQIRLPLTFEKDKGRGRDPHELLADVGMGHKANRRPHELSGGERQRVGIARALVTKPALLLVDEPTAALDRQRSQEIVGMLAQETRSRSVATLMVTHDHDVLHHCDRVYEMIDGRLSLVGASTV